MNRPSKPLLLTPQPYILITGCSTGIGRACAIRLAQAGFRVIASVRTEAEVSSIEQGTAGVPVSIHGIPMDVTDGGSIHRAFEQIRQHVGTEGLYGLVNNAGICVVGPIECITLDNWREQFEVNFFGAIAVTQAMLPLLRAYNASQGKIGARVININSITGEVATPLFAAYSASKFALRAMTDCLRLELRADGIHVCSIVPGTIQTEIWRKEREGIEALATDAKAREFYSQHLKNISDYVFRCAETAIPADRVAKVVERALQSRSPRQRYLVGWEAQVGSRSRRMIPDRLFHFLLGRTLRVPAWPKS
jgi:NAD(P)-dependent dehydrogenase (short-subunit alcohol dehydrogenase family)